MLRAALVSLLNARRNNDVYVLVPVDGDQPARLAVVGVVYDPTSDMVLIRTEPWWATPATDDDADESVPPRRMIADDCTWCRAHGYTPGQVLDEHGVPVDDVPVDDDELRDAHPQTTRAHEGWPAGRAARGQTGPAALPPKSTPVAEHGDDLREPDGNAGGSATGGTAPSGARHRREES